jgi:hypothetical protein
MNVALLYRVLTAAGALAALASILLAALVGLQGVDLGFRSDLIAAVLFYLMGGFAVWQRPQLVAARRLLLAGVLYVGDIAMERLLSLMATVLAQCPGFGLATRSIRHSRLLCCVR